MRWGRRRTIAVNALVLDDDGVGLNKDEVHWYVEVEEAGVGREFKPDEEGGRALPYYLTIYEGFAILSTYMQSVQGFWTKDVAPHCPPWIMDSLGPTLYLGSKSWK